MAQLTHIEINPIEAPEGSVITLAKAKKQLRIETDFTLEDDLIEGYITAAVNRAEEFIGGHIFNKTVTLNYSAFADALVFEIFPVRAINSVQYYQEGADTLTTLDPANYYLRSANLRVQEVVFTTIPEDVADRPDAIVIELQCGYANMTQTPAAIKQAILLMISDMYNYREDRKELTFPASHQLLRPYKKYV
jgi:uncharacterized phiE125 gp8 family phage protein